MAVAKKDSKKMKRFTLKKDCFLVKGVKRSAIYDLESGDVYSMDEDATTLIEKCETGKELNQIFKDYPNETQPIIIGYLENLVKLGLGYFLNNGKKVTKILINQPNSLEFIWLELTAGCNLRCAHCYSGSFPSLLGEEKMGEADWIRVMKESYVIGCRKLQFIGGEPFTLGSKLLKLIVACQNIGYEFIEVYTNATLINDAQIQFLADNKIAVAVSVYGNTQEIHEKVTRSSGSFNQTITNLQKLIKKGVQVRVGIITMNLNEDYVGETVRFLKEDIGVKNVKVDLIRPSGRGCNKDLMSSKLLEKYKLRQPLFSKCTFKTFQRARYGHNCFSRDVCVTASGDVIPCVMERDIVLGNVLNFPLSHILHDKIVKQVRSLNKDNIEVCRDCEYRYCCFDCRPKSKKASLDENLYAKPAECFYDPHTGKWDILNNERR